MLSSRKAIEPRCLHASGPRIILLSQPRTRHRPPSSRISFHRNFSWGSKHKNTTSHGGSVCKGFSTRGFAGKNAARKQLYRSILWGNYHLERYLPWYAPIQDWRFSSSWGKKSEKPSSFRKEAKANEEEEDWYTRWEQQKLRQYNDFMKKVEQDPYTALFGRTWQMFSGESSEPKATRTRSPPCPEETPIPKKERTSENRSLKSNASSTKISGDGDIGGRQSKSETIPIQECGQEYVIDPITNRKVFKTPACPVSVAGHMDSEVKVAGKVIDGFFKRWNWALPTPLDRRSIILGQMQASSGSYPTSEDTPPLKPRKGGWWLTQEGFGNNWEPKADAQPRLRAHETRSNTTATKIESAPDRYLSSRSASEKEKNDRPQLQYKPEENKTEDVDLLRPSDVRASAGLRGSPPKETDVDKKERRQRLEKNYERCYLDRASQSTEGATSKKLVQNKEDRLVKKSTAPELPCGAKWTWQETNLRDKEAFKRTPAVWVNELSEASDCDSVSAIQTLASTPISKNKIVCESMSAVGSRAQAEAKDKDEDKANKLKAQIVPFKAKLDAMKADYDSLRQQWLQEIRRMKEKAAKKEEEKAREAVKRAREIHEEEIRTQKKAMEAMEMRSSHGGTNIAKTGLAKGTGNDDGGPRRLQSFLQGEGDMASNVHEFAGRDRWYKRKAPHAMDAKEVEMNAKLQKLATDRNLIREIRSIYEDTYGTIDTKHRQNHYVSVPQKGPSSQPISSSSGTVDLHDQPPSSSASIMESSRGLDDSQSSDALEIIQKLFGQLREAQAVIQDYRCQTKQALSSNQNRNMSKTSSAFENSVMQIVKTSGQLARVRPGVMVEQSSVEINPEVQKGTKLNNYCILAFDSNNQQVRSSEGTTLAPLPISKEESLLPLDALNRLSNPGKFLPHVMSLGDKGYEPVAGTSNILVFKKEVTPQELAEIEKTNVKTTPKPTRKLLEHWPVICDGSIGSWGGNWHFDPTTEQKNRQAPSQGIEAEQQKVEEAQKQAVEKIEKEHQKVEEARKTAIDDVKKKIRPSEDSPRQEFASSASQSPVSSDKVHRQETVFSGSRQGRWLDNSVKPKKSKRAAGRRRKAMKHMLVAGAFTAACCYCVGVASEMMHSL